MQEMAFSESDSVVQSTAVVVIQDVRDIHMRMRLSAHTGMLIKTFIITNKILKELQQI